jgi:hypothetical protein
MGEQFKWKRQKLVERESRGKSKEKKKKNIQN